VSPANANHSTATAVSTTTKAHLSVIETLAFDASASTTGVRHGADTPSRIAGYSVTEVTLSDVLRNNRYVLKSLQPAVEEPRSRTYVVGPTHTTLGKAERSEAASAAVNLKPGTGKRKRDAQVPSSIRVAPEREKPRTRQVKDLSQRPNPRLV